MYLCYIDESGTSDIPGNTSHFILAGLSIPIWHWKDCDREIETIKKRYDLENKEIHVAWILRPYLEQTRIDDFEVLDFKQRRSKVEQYRKAELLKLQRSKNRKLYKQTRKNYRQTDNFIHLTYRERQTLIADIAKRISKWGFARLFAECVDKIYFDPNKADRSIDEQCFEQLVSRFEQYLQIKGKGGSEPCLGLLIHDNNETIAKKHTGLMKAFHQSGTLWTKISNIIETPLFVDSQLTSMVQIADICAYALRRYLENGEDLIFNLIFQRADRKDDIVVGIRHFTNPKCACKICTLHRKSGI
ncbi:MAG: hypothetical protein A2029_08395 [Chloroflexi bacterium RBG_19FT_COMBO_47_9]|nr:MAG: hypothetical protein A2029_08395 [Chloroflexi bacterium RBG_19FT_COMBO_47_9]